MKPKRSLGQNFFNNLNLAKKIVELSTATSPSLILEIGPGTGYFTKLFIEKGLKIVAVEKDIELSQMLRVQFPTLSLINEDFLDLDLEKLELVSGETVCYGSLPYNISKRIISKLLDSEIGINDFYFIIQKEVAEKYLEKESSILSMTTKLRADSKILLDINPGSFTPKPNVVSSLIHFKRNNNISLVKNREKFIQIVKAAFSKPRKMLKTNLSDFSGIEPSILMKRPHELSFTDYVDISNSVQ